MPVDVHPYEVQPFAECTYIYFDAAFAAATVLGCNIPSKHIVDVNGNVLSMFHNAQINVDDAACRIWIYAYFVVGGIVLNVNNACDGTDCRRCW